MFTGSPEKVHQHAERTYLNAAGPGQYNLPSLTGRHSLHSKLRNLPNFSLALPTKASWHHEFHTEFVGRSSPPATRYSPALGKQSVDRNTSQLGVVGREKKFLQPSSVTNLQERLPIQYGGSYNIDSCNNGFQDVLRRDVNGKV